MTISPEKALAFMERQRHYQSEYRKRVRAVAKAAKLERDAKDQEERNKRTLRIAQEFYMAQANAGGVALRFSDWAAANYPEGV
jgi:hypothetical protein